MREILMHMGLMTNMKLGSSDVGKEITEFHCAMGYWDADDFHDETQKYFSRSDRMGLPSTRRPRYVPFSNLQDQGTQETALLSNPTSIRRPIGP